MTEKNKAANRGGRLQGKTMSGITSTKAIIPQLSSVFTSEIKLIRLYGFSPANKETDEKSRYAKAKQSMDRNFTSEAFEGLSEEAAQAWVDQGGWLGLRVPKGYEVVDVDDKAEGLILLRALQQESINFHAMETTNGYQFFFKTAGRIKKQTAGSVAATGIICDYRLSEKGYSVIPVKNTPERSWIEVSKNLDKTPVFLEPTPKRADARSFAVPIKEPGRNNAIHAWLCALLEFNLWDMPQLKEIGLFMSRYIIEGRLEDGELEKTMESALRHKPSGKDYENAVYRPKLTRDLKLLLDRPGPEKAKLPKGWELEETTLALYQVTSRADFLVSHQPIVITGCYENLSDKTIGLAVAYLQNKRWKHIYKSRDYLMTQHKLVDLSATGFPVSSSNARKLVNYLQDYEARNMATLPRYRVSEQLGFVDDGFLLGKTFIHEDGTESAEMEEGAVSFSGADTGDEQFIEGFTTAGTLENWLEAIGKVRKYPRVLTGVLASFASVLAPVVKSSVFIYELAGETSKGKTIALRTFASVWGNPDEMEGGIVRKWNTTPVNLERMAGTVNHLPLFLDDTKEANEKQVSQAIYQLASGQGKGRGSTKGTQRTKNWRNVIFSTGEQKITSFSKDGGTAGRTLSILGMPFEKADRETYKVVHQLDIAIKENYGHAGRVFIKAILEQKENWSQWRQAWSEYRNHFSELITDVNSVAGRLAAYMALIALAGELFCKVFKLNWNLEKPLQQLWDDIIRENSEADRPLEALQQVYGSIRANKGLFQQSLDTEHVGYCLGEWENANGNWKDIKLIPSELENMLEKLGYEPKATLKSWLDRGWLAATKGRGFRKQVKRNGNPVDYIMLKRSALEL